MSSTAMMRVYGGIKQAQALKAQNELNQKQVLKQDLDTQFDRTMEALKQSSQQFSKMAFSGDESAKAQAIKGQTATAQTLWAETNRMFETAVRTGIMTQEEANARKEQFRIGARLIDPVGEQRMEERVQTEALAEREATEQGLQLQFESAIEAQEQAGRMQLQELRGEQQLETVRERARLEAEAAKEAGEQGKGKMPISENAQGDFTQSFAALKMLDIMEGNIGTSGRLEGPIQEVLAFLGLNPNAVDFNVARNQFKLMAQSLIKGTPSNFDVQTVIATLPSLMSSETMNKARIDLSRDLFKQLIEDKIAFYKGTNRNIPDDILEQAQQFGIGVDNIKPTETYQDNAQAMLYERSTDQDLAKMFQDPEVSDQAKAEIRAEFERRMTERDN